MDDKKKIGILAGLFLVMIGIGAFSFVKSGGSAEPATPIATEKKSTEEPTAAEAKTTPESNTGTQVAAEKPGEGEEPKPGESTQPEIDPGLIAAARLNARDPFDGRKWDLSLAKPTAPPVPQAGPRIAPPIRAPRNIGGQLPPFDPTKGGVFPEGSGQPIGAGVPLPNLDEFPYTVSGTMQGDRPCVVVTDKAGKQKLVPVGGSIDGDSQVISISRGQVTVRHRGKTKSFPVGGTPTPNETKQEGN